MPSSPLRRPLLALLAAAALSACGRADAAAGAIPRDRFVAANVALRLVPDTVPNADSLRAAALRKHRVTAKELRAFVTAHEAEYLAEAWKAIAERVDSLNESARLAAAKAVKPGATGQAVAIPGNVPPGEIAPLPGGPPPPPNPNQDAARRRVRLPSVIQEQQQPGAPNPAPPVTPDRKPARRQ
ncbi:MAG TPA: hypothetical protein VFQ45_07400 [Longimicrobium sp.]|nr:hypothetical protein [Longimicrobium sp.]